MTPEGMPLVTPRIELGDPNPPAADVGGVEVIHHDEAFQILDAALGDLGFSVWLALDRLDEAFAGMP